MAKSLGEALAKGQPVVFTIEGRPHQVVCEPGKEREALELMEKMGLILLMRPDEGKRPAGTVKPFEEKEEDWRQALDDAGWTVECESPFEVRHEDGSFASGSAARYVVKTVQEGEE